jgi:hypothetical protein
VFDHPLTGQVAKRLLWQVRPDGERAESGGVGRHDWVTVLPAADGTPLDAAGRPVRLPPAYQARLWHPAGADRIDAEAWTALRGRQPVAQLDRTTYHPTPAEVASGHRSARFAGHLVRRRAAAAWLAGQGWTVDRKHRLAATTEVLDGRTRAVLSLAQPEDPALARSGRVSGEVAFERRAAGGTWAPLPVPEVHPRLFSEVMWDLDHMVRVARDEVAALQEQVASLLPRLRIADRCRLEGRDLHVRGDRGTYSISLANAAVYELRLGGHVCIVQAWNHNRDDGLNPLPGPADPDLDGERLRMILSKAFLLADDTNITDEVILSQLPPGAGR